MQLVKMEINYKYFRDEIPVEVIEDICTNREVVLDVETCNKEFDGQDYGLDFLQGTIRLLQLATKNNVYIFDYLYLDNVEKQKLNKVFKYIKVIITHHGQFDIKFCWSCGIPVDDCEIIFYSKYPEMRRIFDAEYIIWLNTIPEGRFADTNKIFEPPDINDPKVFVVNEQYAEKWASLILRDFIKEV